MTAITRQEALTTYDTQFPNVRLKRVALIADASSDVKTGGEPHIKDTSPKAGLTKQPSGPTCSADITFVIEELAGAINMRDSNIPQVSAESAATTKIKFAVLDTTGPINISFSETGEPVFVQQTTNMPAVSEKVFSYSELVQTDLPNSAKNTVVTENSIIRTASVTLRDIPSDIANMSLVYMTYVNKDDMVEYYTAKSSSNLKIAPMQLPNINSPHTRQVLVRGGEVTPTLEKFFDVDGREFSGHPYMKQDANGRISYSSSFEDGDNPQNAIVQRSVVNNITQDFRNVALVKHPAALNFTSTHNLIENLGVVTKDLGQRLNFFENEAVFSTLQTSFDEQGKISGLFSVDLLKALKNETLFPALLESKDDELKRNFVQEVIDASEIKSMSITRREVLVSAEQSELGQGSALLTSEVLDNGHVVVTTSRGGTGSTFKNLDYAGGSPSTLPQNLCGTMQQIGLGGFGLRHFIFKDHDVSVNKPGRYQYTCQANIDNGLRRVLTRKRNDLNTQTQVLKKVYEIASQGSTGKGTGHYNSNIKTFRPSFSQELISLYGLSYEDIISRAIGKYVNLLFALTDERDRKIFDNPNSQTTNISTMSAGKLYSILSGYSMTLEGLETLINVVDGLNTSIHTAIGTPDKNNLSREENSRVDGPGGVSNRAILEIENKFDEIIEIKNQVKSKYDFIFDSRGDVNDAIRTMDFTAFEDRWALQQKKYFGAEVVEENRQIEVPLPLSSTSTLRTSALNTMIHFSPARITGELNQDEILITGDINSPSTGPGAHRTAFQKLLHESSVNELDTSNSVGQIDNAARAVSSVILNESLATTSGVTILEKSNDVTSFDGKLTADSQEVLGNSVSLSLVEGFKHFEGLINYLAMDSSLSGFRDDLKVYNVRPTSEDSLKITNLSQAGYSIFSDNFSKLVSDTGTSSYLMDEMPSSVMSLILASTPQTDQTARLGISAITETGAVSTLENISSLNSTENLPYFILNYKIIACLEVFTGFEEKVYTDEETSSTSKDYCMGEPTFVKTNLTDLRQLIQEQGQVLCRIKRYYRSDFNIKENENFDFPIANSLFVLKGTQQATTTTPTPSGATVSTPTVGGTAAPARTSGY